MAAFKPLATLEDARDPWLRLAESTANVFSTWEWARAWWLHFGAGRELALIGVFEQTETVAILPLVRERQAGIRLTRFLGHGVGDQLGPVCQATRLPEAGAWLQEAQVRGPILLAERLPPVRDWAADLAGRTIKTDQSPVIDLAGEGDWEQYLAQRSANFRQQVRRRSRRLQRGLGVTFRLTEDAGQLERALDALMRLHAARWGERSRAFVATRAQFHREFAANALERGWLRLWLAEAEGTPVAAWYGFRFAGVESFYQSGRDPSWDQFGIGAGLLEHSIREAFADGMREYRLLRGDEAYKARYATSDSALQTVISARGARARLLAATASRLAGYAGARRLFTGRADD